MKSDPFRIFGFWAGSNPMPDVRRECFETFVETDLRPVLVTPDNLSEWIIPDHPLHPAYEFLSPVHRSDYLRPYFMHHHGGGYADIKRQRGRWRHWVDNVLHSRLLVGAGYREIRGGTPWLQNHVVNGRPHVLSHAVPPIVAKLATDAMRGFHGRMIGNCAFYFKPGTSFTRRWLRNVERRLDMLLPALRENPAQTVRAKAGDGSGYPVPWSFIQADVFSPLTLIYAPRLARSLPAPQFSDYIGSDKTALVTA